jgi:Sulfotransferase family
MSSAADYRPRVLLITGFGRSGTTLVNRILGSTPGVFAGGEIRFLWERGILEGRHCGCGEPLDACPIWGPALEKAATHHGDVNARALVAEDAKVTRTRQLPLLLGSRVVGDQLMRRLDALPDALTAVYRSLQEVTGARVIVDSSKPPSFGYVLDHLDGIDLRILHLVRDPRAVAYSWTRSKRLVDGGARTEMQRLSPLESSLQWDLWNGAAGWLWGRSERYLRLRYEDFVADPQHAFERIAAFVGEPDLQPPFIGPRQVAAATVHAVAGNADRMRTGRIEIRSDDEWERQLPRRTRWLVTALTLPFLVRYRYPASLRADRPTG